MYHFTSQTNAVERYVQTDRSELNWTTTCMHAVF